jgi:manganese/zinc/iron transport system substrate-binding protein
MYHKLHMGKKKQMKSRKNFRGVLAAVLAAFFLVGTVQAQGKLQVATTIGMVADLARQVGGERVEVEQLMGPGVDPHLYKPTSTDASRLSKADVIFYSGLMLEGRMGDLFARLARSGKKVYPTTESVPENLLTEPKEFEGHTIPTFGLM